MDNLAADSSPGFVAPHVEPENSAEISNAMFLTGTKNLFRIKF
jgi:hypothetical protein